MKVLCLHGSRQNGEVFANRISGIVRRFHKAGFELFFPDGSVELPLQEGQEVAMRSWWRREANEGWQASLATILTLEKQQGSFDGILGK